MPTVRIRDASEYPEPARRLFELSSAWFGHDFAAPPAMSRVMAWDPGFGGPHGRAMNTKIADTLQLDSDMGDIAPVDPSPAPGGPNGGRS